ncbi:20409_t:CDS:10 [Funneliformis geosporum]|uniref:13067_t:CDS:1 n=1 Tax=Funneliformis geosporum TaxID=1117311 RepID=A0A9W4X3K9_9GLOM|nr:13067_t:CDS:10 [Funneliformis geosporum]CAI2186601.1 20409_t:CDS:10 [Funneliformis geosporum]
MATTSSDLAVDARCEIQGKTGTIRFVGPTTFATGKWVGVELDEPSGKNDGSVAGKHYFDCRQNHGVFVRPSQIKTIGGSINSSQKQSPQSFAPPHDPNSSNVRSILRPPSVSGNMRINTSGIPNHNRISRGPNSPTTGRLNSLGGRGPNSPTFPRRPRGNSDASSIDVKRSDIDPALLANEMGEDESDININDGGLYEDTLENDLINESASKPDILKFDNLMRRESTPTLDPFSLQEASVIREQTVPLKEYEELRLKLKILENKRQEDREKIRETEKMKVEAEQFLSAKPKLQSKMAEMQQELRELRKQLKDANAEKEAYEGKYNEAVESMEMMTLDKEMAEEKAENLQHEVNLLKEKVEEISVDLTVFKQEGDTINQTDANGEARPAVEIIQLERQNDRLKEALVKLRDVTSEQEAELNKKIKSLEKELVSLQDIQVQHDQMKNQLKEAESAIEDLKIRLDDAMNADYMLEQLTEKNLAQGDRLEEMRVIIEDLEALKELNDELEESHIEDEKQLQAEIDHKDTLIREYLKRIEMSDETNADYENTINQFRELVGNLQSDLEQFRQKEESQYSESKNLSSQSQTMLDLNFKLQSTVLKAQAKQIDLELRKLDVTQASENLAFVQPYLPDSFFRSEHDSIRCLLLLKRLVFKSELIIKQVDQIHNIPEKLNTVVPEELMAVCEFRQRLAWFSDISRRLVSFVNTCPVETFIKMGQVYHDLVGTERRLHAIVDLLRKEELKEAECITDVQRSIAQLEHLAEIYLSNTKIDEADRLYAYSRGLDLNADTIAVSLGHLKQSVALACKDEEIIVTEGIDKFNSDFFLPLQSLVSQSRSSKVIARKLIRRLDDMADQNAGLKSDLLAQFKMCFSISTKLTSFCQEVWKGISVYIHEKKDTKEELLLCGLQQIIYRVTENILGINEVNMWDGCTKSLLTLYQEICNLNNASNDPENSTYVKKGEAPWNIRAKELKAELLVNADMERKAQLQQEEIRELIREKKAKDQLLQESSVKIELLEKRMETVKKQADKINALEQELENSRKQETDFEEAMESLQQELETLEQQNRHFVLLGNIEDGAIPPRNTEIKDEDIENDLGRFTDINPLENQRLTSQIESLKFAIRYLRAENSHLKGKDALNALDWHLQPKRRRAFKNQDEEELMKSVTLEAKSLLKDFRNVSASPRVIDITRTLENQKQWRPLKMTPEYQYQSQQSVIYTLQQRSNELKLKLQKLGKNNLQKPSKNGDVGIKPSIIGRIRLPVLDKDLDNSFSNHHNIKLKNPLDFEKIHTIFVN